MPPPTATKGETLPSYLGYRRTAKSDSTLTVVTCLAIFSLQELKERREMMALRVSKPLTRTPKDARQTHRGLTAQERLQREGELTQQRRQEREAWAAEKRRLGF
jgi:hypothetical protein